ncbi:ZZ-type zinc finger-containing protein 3 [Drosophila eugracilis]|uniref:ZZ-type zinc finger-containing protein 3 n=1 Tax=Drosophila eugracilis TaxID=29029 RepID=UPI001BDAC567|nr:ZZ-type zinc finger-containing protein 3 [Drosophila eugracilis]
MEPVPIEDQSLEDEDVFHFETEHLALRGNQCYANLLRTMAVLQAQRIRVHQQIDELEATRNVYLDNPQLMLDKLQNNESIISDNYINTVVLPELPTLSANDERGGLDKTLAKAASWSQQTDEIRDRSNGRSENFNRLWTNEEQRRLEQLLIQYPPEEVEMRRFGKIAKALGNRTAQQVFSRVQKYFQKLHDAGMPVPGRIPKHRRPGLSKPKVHLRKSTFFPAQNISLQMPEDDIALDDLRVPSPANDMLLMPVSSQIKIEAKTEHDYVDADLDAESKRKQELRLKLLTAIQEEKQQVENGYGPDMLASKCAECEESSVTRTQWRCNSCYCHLNLCGDCLASQLIEGRFEHLSHEVIVDQEC